MLEFLRCDQCNTPLIFVVPPAALERNEFVIFLKVICRTKTVQGRCDVPFLNLQVRFFKKSIGFVSHDWHEFLLPVKVAGQCGTSCKYFAVPS